MSDSSQMVIRVPTYYGDSTEGKEEFDSPYVPCVMKETGAAHMMLGTDNPLDITSPEIIAERRPGGWAIFLNIVGDTKAIIYFLDSISDEDDDENEVVVLPDGFINRVRVVHCLDEEFGNKLRGTTAAAVKGAL